MTRPPITVLCVALSAVLVTSAQMFAQGESGKVWIYFRDRGPAITAQSTLKPGTAAWRTAESNLTPRALERRSKSLPHDFLIGESDLPVYQQYIEEIERSGGRLHVVSRWMNAASFFLDPNQVQSVRNLNFVANVVPVRVFERPQVRTDAPADQTGFGNATTNYGPSLMQNQMIGATNAHALGVTGRGVIVGMLDTGFRWRSHEALRNAQVVGERDFIQNDDVTENQGNDSPDQDAHGTLTMSIVGGYKPGQLIGPAYSVQFLLGKTEYVPSETRIEEDDYVAGLEWMESRGVDIVSSSLGYDRFDDGFRYRWENGDFNGRTAVTTRAAARAARLGVLVCTAMGNEGNGNGIRGTLLTPADADDILSVGALTFDRTLAGFSSTGPTNDGRIKPDISAPGVQVVGAWTSGPTSYLVANGTSTSTPLVAAAGAMLLSARPELSAAEARNILLATSDTVATADPRSATRPNNFTGYGLVNVFSALLAGGPVFSNTPTLTLTGLLTTATITVASRFGLRPESIRISYSSAVSSGEAVLTIDSVMFFPTSGRYRFEFPSIQFGTRVRFSITAQDHAGNRYSSPPNSSREQWEFYSGSTIIGTMPNAFRLEQNYPNPFNAMTRIEFDSPRSSEVSLEIYNLLGQRVRTLFRGTLAGTRKEVWDGTNEEGIPLPSGVYIYMMRASDFRATKKMILIR